MESDRIEKLKKELLATERYNNTNIISDTVISLVGIFIPGVETVKNIVNEKVNAFQSKKQLQFCEVELWTLLIKCHKMKKLFTLQIYLKNPLLKEIIMI